MQSGAKGRKINAIRMAGEPGFEPGLTESESAGLPLTYSPVQPDEAKIQHKAARHHPVRAFYR